MRPRRHRRDRAVNRPRARKSAGRSRERPHQWAGQLRQSHDDHPGCSRRGTAGRPIAWPASLGGVFRFRGGQRLGHAGWPRHRRACQDRRARRAPRCWRRSPGSGGNLVEQHEAPVVAGGSASPPSAGRLQHLPSIGDALSADEDGTPHCRRYSRPASGGRALRVGRVIEDQHVKATFMWPL